MYWTMQPVSDNRLFARSAEFVEGKPQQRALFHTLDICATKEMAPKKRYWLHRHHHRFIDGLGGWQNVILTSEVTYSTAVHTCK